MQVKRSIQDIDSTIREMDQQYDANFGEWVRSEENLDILAANFKKYITEYTDDTFAAVLTWVTGQWKPLSKILLLKKLFAAGIFLCREKENSDTPRKKIQILKKVVEHWTPADVSDLIIEFLIDMQKEEKKLFLLWLLEDFDHRKLTEIFIRIDSIVDWSLKISIIKKSRNFSEFPEGN
ncbi:hypothetical protein NEHOM01_1242 [Nematocida homosporus]|uniref:uncharacterized protein n=1 Tax=Nematocida homosporus TaxID=1912981 RepID=UPI00221EB6CB|nr:uncharacterized protein NEHOM01_1242 [Nematocida homosporus]KAI5186039.1 hypothetical protein NEHOM01_1242 [Nematocida homosporus]